MSKKILSINDIVHGMIEITSLENEIISHGLFNRLHDIYQNSTVYLTFPTNRTKRFEHSIGTMHLAGKMLFHSLYNAAIQDESVFNTFIEQSEKNISIILAQIQEHNFDMIREKISPIAGVNEFNINRLKDSTGDLEDGHLKRNVLLLKNVDRKNSRANDDIYLAIVYQSVRIAALLHDIGHPPFSHITESSLEKVFSECLTVQPNSSFVQIYKQAKGESGDQLHEKIGDKIVDSILNDVVPKAMQVGPINNVVWYRSIIWICVKSILSDGRIVNSKREKVFTEDANQKYWKLLHSLIDGEVDCDRLDYVVRDGLTSGMQDPRIEYDRIICNMKLCSNEGSLTFAFLAKSMKSIEDFFFKRYRLYDNIISHHRVVKTDWLFSSVIEKLSKKYLQIHTDDTAQIILPNDISGLWKALNNINNVGTDTYNLLLQWDDSWLITVLKNERYNNLYKNEDNDSVLCSQLDEILTNKKYYFSAVKRGYDFEFIDEAFCKKIKQKIEGYNNQDCKEYHLKAFIDFIRNNCELQGFASAYKIFALYYFYTFVLPSIHSSLNEKSNKECIEEMWRNDLTVCANNAKTKFNNNNFIIDDVFVGIKSTRGNIKKAFYLYRPVISDKDTNRLLVFNNESNIGNVIDLLMGSSPCFYVYIKKNKTNAPDHINANDFLTQFGEELGEYYGTKILKILQEENK